MVVVVVASFCFRVVSSRLVLFVVGAVLALEGLVGWGSAGGVCFVARKGSVDDEWNTLISESQLSPPNHNTHSHKVGWMDRCQDDHSGANPFILSSEIVFETKQPPKPTFQLQDVILIAPTNPQAGLPVPFGAGSLLAPPNYRPPDLGSTRHLSCRLCMMPR